MELQLEHIEKAKTASKAKTVSVDDAVYAQEYNQGLVPSYNFLSNSRTSRYSRNKKSFEVRGGGAKPWRQKGTGRARAGTRSSPIWRVVDIHFLKHLTITQKQQKSTRKSIKVYLLYTFQA